MKTKYNIFIILLAGSVAYSQCIDYSEIQCTSNSDCEWIEDIEYGNCSWFDQDHDACEETLGCWGAYAYPGWYSGWYCAGGTYSVDNSFCQDIPECSELSEIQCENNDSCTWFDDSYGVNCSDLTVSECTQYFDFGCALDADCEQWGSWYTWLCYDYGPSYCTGGNILIDNSVCEDIQYQMGDINSDFFINILDVIETITLILNSEYNYIVDMNHDQQVNVLDIIQIVGIILS